MNTLELGLRLEVLGFRAAPPLGETTKEKGYKIQEAFLPCYCVFFLFFIVFCLLFFCFTFVPHLAFVVTCSLLCVVLCVTLMLLTVMCRPSPYVAPARVVRSLVLFLLVVINLALLLFDVICHFTLLLLFVVHHFVLLLLFVVHHFVPLLLFVVHHFVLLLLVILLCIAPTCYGLSPYVTAPCYGLSPYVTAPCCDVSPCVVVCCVCHLRLALLLFVMVDRFSPCIVINPHHFQVLSSPSFVLYYLLWFVIPHFTLLLFAC
jgi:hypothetical protein